VQANRVEACYNLTFLLRFTLALLAAIRVFFRSRHDTALEILALRQQVAVLKRKRPRPRLNRWDRLFWTTLRQAWLCWAEALVIVEPETVVGWHRAGFRLFWRWRSRARGGRPETTAEIRVLIRQLAQENLSWGNHREMIAALDFFTVPMVTFKLLYCFFVVEHGRRQILHFNVTRHPTAEWVIQQLREAFPEVGKLRYIILDRDAKFNADVLAFLKATGLKPKRTSIQSPWQNGVAERWVGGCRRELLDHVIPLNEDHLRRLVREYISYFTRTEFTIVSPRTR
jgi:putative transposase